MIVRRNLKWSIIIRGALMPLCFWTITSVVAYFLYFYFKVDEVAFPFAPIAVLGTALSIFLGFRNSSSYDRWWEARKIWGGIVNNSRTFGRQIITLSNFVSEKELKEFHKQAIYRHLAWINALRLQLRSQTEAILWNENVYKFLSAEEIAHLEKAKNKSTQLMMLQAKQVTEATGKKMFDDFRHIQLDNTLSEFYNLQGAAERIKNTPLPRQYDFFNRLFMQIFIFFLPFGLLEVFAKSSVPALIIPFTVIIGFVFYVIEGVGRRNEDPFENKIADTPMSAICRTIEIDLRQMLGEEEVPPKLEAVDGFLY